MTTDKDAQVTAPASKIIDFDAFRKEQDKKPVILRIGGKDYNLSPELPAAVALDIVRMQREHGADEDVPPEKIEELGVSLIGEQFHSILREHNVGLEEMAWLVQQALRVYNQEMPGPNRQTRRSQSKRPRSRS